MSRPKYLIVRTTRSYEIYVLQSTAQRFKVRGAQQTQIVFESASPTAIREHLARLIDLDALSSRDRVPGKKPSGPDRAKRIIPYYELSDDERELLASGYSCVPIGVPLDDPLERFKRTHK